MERDQYQGAWVKQHRDLLGFTQEQLADAVRDSGVRLSRPHLANIEAGTYGPSPGLVKCIAVLCGLDIRDAWRHVGTLPRTRRGVGPTLHAVSQVSDSAGPAAPAAEPAAQLGVHAPPTELLDWARRKLASLVTAEAGQTVVLTTAGPLAKALRAAPPQDGILGGILGKGIRAVLDGGGELRHVLAVQEDPEAHLAVLAEALPLAARYSVPPARSHPHLSRYSLILVPASAGGTDLIASSLSPTASMLVPVIADGQEGVAAVDMAAPDAEAGTGPPPGWARDYASWLAAPGAELFSWVTVLPGGTFSALAEPWEEKLTHAWETPAGRDSIQRMLPLSTMSYDLRSQLVAEQIRRRDHRPARAGSELRRRLNLYRSRRAAMIRNLENGYRYRHVVTREALHDLVEHGQYTMERLADHVLTKEQAAANLQATIELIRGFPNFQVLILTDDQLSQALPLGASWMVMRSPHSQPASQGPAWVFLPYELNGETMAMNAIVSDSLAVEGICRRIDILWETWAEGRTAEQIREETLAALEQAQGHSRSRPAAKGRLPANGGL